MKLRPITTKQFFWSLPFILAAFVLWLLLPIKILGLVCIPMGISGMILIPRKEYFRKLNARDTLAILLVFLFMGVIIVLSRWIPKQWEKIVIRVWQHPLFVVPLFTLLLFMTYQRWRCVKVKTQE